MRILLDENTPRGVRRILTGHDVRTAPEMGWAAYSNGQLLDEAEKAGFDALVTCDQNLIFQQNLTGRNIAVVILSTNVCRSYVPSPRECSMPSPAPPRGHSQAPTSAASADSGPLPIEAREIRAMHEA